jgi:hypothetical protein
VQITTGDNVGGNHKLAVIHVLLSWPLNISEAASSVTAHILRAAECAATAYVTVAATCTQNAQRNMSLKPLTCWEITSFGKV